MVQKKLTLRGFIIRYFIQTKKALQKNTTFFAGQINEIKMLCRNLPWFFPLPETMLFDG